MSEDAILSKRYEEKAASAEQIPRDIRKIHGIDTVNQGQAELVTAKIYFPAGD